MEIEDEKCATQFINFTTIINERILRDPLLSLGDHCRFRLAYYNEDRDLDDDDNCIGRIKKGKKIEVLSGEAELYYSSCDDKKYVLKIQNEYNRNEINFQLTAANFGIAPPIYEIWFCFNEEPSQSVCPRTSLFVMKQYKQSYKEVFSKASSQLRKEYLQHAISLLTRLHRLYIFHQDCHFGNFMIGFDGEIVLIDYGQASRRDVKNDFNILYNEVYSLRIPTDEKRSLLDSIPNTQPNGNPPLLDLHDRKEERQKTIEQKVGFTRVGSKYGGGARSSGYIRRQEVSDEEEYEDD